MSLVELMVGVTIGLFIVAAATLMIGNQLSDNRRLLLETQLQQDMRASMDIITRQIRRAGLWEENNSITLLASDSGLPGNFTASNYAVNITPDQKQITFNYWLNAQDKDNWGFKLENGRIKSSLARLNWQDLTDPNTVEVTTLQFVEVTRDSEFIPCPKLCTGPGGPRACWPKVAVRSIRVVLEARSVNDPTVTRRLESEARLRNNLPIFNGGSTTQPCPP